MSKFKFSGKVLFLILAVVSFHTLGIELLLYFVTDTPLNELKLILSLPLPLAIGLIGTYCVISFYYCRPINMFLDADTKGKNVDFEQIQTVQNRCINLPYFLAGLSFPAYIAGGAGGAWIWQVDFNWPTSSIFYGFVAGIIAGFITIPMAMYATAWATRPVMQRTIEIDKKAGRPTAKRAGLKLSLAIKFVLIVFVMVSGITAYGVIIGYGKTNAILENMEKIEQLLPPSKAAELASEIKHSRDTRIRSAKYFKSRMGSLQIFFISIIIAGSALALIVGIGASAEVTRPIRALRTIAEQIREGHYDQSVHIVTDDEFAELGEIFNKMTEKLLAQLNRSQSMLDSIDRAVGTLAPMSKELISISEQQSTISIEQSSAAEEAATAGIEIAAVAKQIAMHASEVSAGAEKTLNTTRQGQNYLDLTREKFDDIDVRMNNIANAVVEINRHSQDIGDIVRLINDISEQTNILSLNAAIEAVGAGVQGKRFGIVAQEVRRLAQNTAQSTGKIQDIIDRMKNSVDSAIILVEEGNKAVGKGREAMGEMAKSFNEIFKANADATPRLKEIGLMTSQQATASEQMTHNITEMREKAYHGSSSAAEIQSSLKQLDTLILQLQAHKKEKSDQAAI